MEQDSLEKDNMISEGTGNSEESAAEDEGNSIYGDHLPELRDVMNHLVDEVTAVRRQMISERGYDPVEHCLSRIKTEDSMREKCRRKGLPETTESALTKIYDAIGVRVVCSFLSDVYVIRDHLAQLPDVEVVEEKDYIRHAKPNGYRSYHMILRVRGKVYAEIQLRTISQDTWAALEHQLKYKKNLNGNTNLIVEELKRCADELASTDISMQTIRDMIAEGDGKLRDIIPEGSSHLERIRSRVSDYLEKREQNGLQEQEDTEEDKTK